MRKIVLHQIPEDFDPESHLPLAPWCFLGREQVWRDWESLPHEPDPFASGAAVTAAARETVAAAIGLLPQLAEQLNEENACSLDIEFWRMKLMPWLLMLLQVVLERQLRCAAFAEKHAHEPLLLTVPEPQPDWNFDSTRDFVANGLRDLLFNEWLCGEILSKMAPARWRVSYKRTHRERKAPARAPTTGLLARFTSKAAHRFSSINGVGPIESVAWSFFVASLRGEPRPRTALPTPWPRVEFAIDITNLIERTLPTKVRTLIRRRPRHFRRHGKTNVVGPKLNFDDVAKEEYAWAHLAGERIVCVQHGGAAYGVSDAAAIVNETEYRHEAFLSWGWEQHSNFDVNAIPLPSPFLSRHRNSHTGGGKALILVSTIGVLLPDRLESVPQPLQQLATRRERRAFLHALDGRIRDSIRFRPHEATEAFLDEAAYFAREFPSVPLVSGKLTPHLLNCRMVVMDNPSTTLNLVMAANVPTIGFWDKDAWALCPQALPIYEALEDLGVFVGSGTQAAEKVEQVWDDVASWWGSADVQAARAAFCERYASTDRSWRRAWLRRLSRI